MKNLIRLLFILNIAWLPLTAHSFNDGALIQSGVMWFGADDECGAETEFTSFQGGGFIMGTEGLFVDGIKWGDLSQLPTSGYSVGDKISYGTDALAARLNYSFDVKLEVDICRNLQLGAQISYRGSGGTDLSSYDLTQAPTIMGAYSYSALTGNYDYVDLNSTRITITSLDGSTISFGAGQAPSTGDTGSGGCSLAASLGGTTALGGWGSLVSLLAFLTWRRFRP